MKKLSEMSLEELWQLFPIFLTEHNLLWEEWYEEEVGILKGILSDCKSIVFSHIGSTAIKGIWAKPIIDILIEVPESETLQNIKNKLTGRNYICMSEDTAHISLNKGYTEEGFAEKVFHIHLRYGGDNDEVYFRDYLNSHPSVAKEYEKLKLTLWKQYEHDRDAYTAAKTDFIQKYTTIAKNIKIF